MKWRYYCNKCNKLSTRSFITPPPDGFTYDLFEHCKFCRQCGVYDITYINID